MATSDEAARIKLGSALKECREYLGFSQDEVADAVGMNRSAVSLIENGQRKVEIFELKRFSALYDRPLEYFTSENPTEAKEPIQIEALARTAKRLSTKDLEELQRFAEFLQTRQATPQGRSNE